jgi:hypothetical protein
MSIDFPITRHILTEFESSMSAVIDASDLCWNVGHWPRHFYILGREGAFNFFSDVKSNEGELQAKVYRDSLGYEIIVNND